MRTRIVIAALGALFLAGPALADTINVPADQPTISDAVANAADGDTIVVKKGRYEESVEVAEFAGITIRGKGKVVIAPPTGPGIYVHDCSDVSIQGIAVENADDGFVFEDCQNVDLTKFSVKSVDRHGVFAFGSSNVNVSRGKVENCGRDGVSYADEVPESPVMGGTISKVKVDDCDEDGIDILGVDILVEKCKASNCDDDTFESDDLGDGPVRFEKCKASNSGDEGFEMGCAATVAIKCKAKDCDDDGFDIEGDDCQLEKCSSKGAAEAGFSIDDIDNCKLTKCKASKNGDGFDFVDATNAALEKCKATKNEDDGFALDGGTQNCVLTKCKGSKNGDVDLDDDSDGSNTFPGSKFKTTTGD